MAENVTLGSFSTLQNSSIISTLNANNTLIETAFADCVSLAGTSPNAMQANVDMNNHQIVNLPAPATLNSPVRLADVSNVPNVPTVNSTVVQGSPTSGGFLYTDSSNKLQSSSSLTQASGIIDVNNYMVFTAPGGFIVMSAGQALQFAQTAGLAEAYGDGTNFFFLNTPAAGVTFLDSNGGVQFRKQSTATPLLQIDGNGNTQVGNGAIATNATNGFLYIPTCAGPPTGVPTAKSGAVPMIYDTTNNKFYIYNGSWKGGTNPGTFT